MPSSFTSRLKLERQASGENSGTWGNLVNYVLNRVDASVSGYQAVNVAGSANVTLTSNNSTSNTDDSTTDDQVHNATLEFTGALTGDIHVFTDAVEQNYVVFNNTTGSQSLTFANTGHAANGVALKQGAKTIVYTDGSTIFDVTKDLGDIQVTGLTSNGGATVTGNVDITGNVALKTAKALVFEDTSGGQFAALKANGTTTSYTLTLPPATGSADQVIKTDGSGNLSFTDMGGGSVTWQTGSIKTATFTAAAGEGYFCNTTGGTFTVNLPSSPTAGDIVAVKDYAGTFDTNKLTIGRGGSNIDATAADVDLTDEAESITLIYVDGTQGWKVINNSNQTFEPQYVAATGGNSTATSGDYKIHTFTSPGTFCVTNTGNEYGNDKISYLIIAGGGGGGSTNSTDDGGGGGAGGYREGKDSSDPYSAGPPATTHTTLSATGAYAIAVGGGGGGGPGTPEVPGTQGSDSSFNSIVSAGGGGARGSGSTPPPSDANGGSGGGSGGGGGVPGKQGGSGNTPAVSPSQGNNGGQAATSPPDGSAGGGGGIGSVGGTAGGSSANGGSGVSSSINGTPTARAGGGGAATASGQDGGGPNGSAGTANTGGGGGGNQNGSGAGAGGSGLVIIRYKFQN